MFSELRGTTDGATALSVAALIVFVVCFTAVVVWTFRLDRGLVNEIARLPLEDGAADQEVRGENE